LLATSSPFLNNVLGTFQRQGESPIRFLCGEKIAALGNQHISLSNQGGYALLQIVHVSTHVTHPATKTSRRGAVLDSLSDTA
jgi:hypothetical protein